ncbi:MAG: FAD-dependent oxidoreductase, partial [Thermoleophilaceae bacterium]|nr:FAD-dependent oxidoreductase [Thermoleophilaceae bacterium]
AGLLPAGALADPGRLERLGESPIVNLHVVYDRPVTDLPFAAAVGSPVQWVFDRSDSSGLASGQYLAVSLSGATEEITLRPDALRERFLPALADLFPGAHDARVERFFATREPAATFRAAPGVARLRPGARTRVPGLVLAGAWTDTGWPATMEGAVRSGLTAAEEVVTTLAGGRPQGASVRASHTMRPIAAGLEPEATPR